MASLISSSLSVHSPLSFTPNEISSKFSARTSRSSSAHFPSGQHLSRRNAGQRKLSIRAENRETSESDDEFESRLAKIRKGGSGTGKKAELRKMRKSGEPEFDFGQTESTSSSAKSSTKESLALPANAISDPKSGGAFVELGFTEYSEKLHGQFALIGLGALLSVELTSGRSLVSYHDSATLSIQIYFILGLAALYVKWEKERKSVWPN